LSVISSFSNLNRRSSSLGLFYNVPVERDQGDWDWRWRLNDTPNAIGCISCISCTCSYVVYFMYWFDFVWRIATNWFSHPTYPSYFTYRPTIWYVCIHMHQFIVTHSWHENNMVSCIGWQRLIRCLKLQVIFRKRATNYRAHLRKMAYEDQAPYASTPPCNELHCTIQQILAPYNLKMQHTRRPYNVKCKTSTNFGTLPYEMQHTLTPYNVKCHTLWLPIM